MYSSQFIIDSLDVSSRAKRRRAVKFVALMLEKIRSAEEFNLERFPLNLQAGNAFVAANYSLEIISDTILGLWDAYNS